MDAPGDVFGVVDPGLGGGGRGGASSSSDDILSFVESTTVFLSGEYSTRAVLEVVETLYKGVFFSASLPLLLSLYKKSGLKDFGFAAGAEPRERSSVSLDFLKLKNLYSKYESSIKDRRSQS